MIFAEFEFRDNEVLLSILILEFEQLILEVDPLLPFIVELIF